MIVIKNYKKNDIDCYLGVTPKQKMAVVMCISAALWPGFWRSLFIFLRK